MMALHHTPIKSTSWTLKWSISYIISLHSTGTHTLGSVKHHHSVEL